MKKILSLCVAALAAITMTAQDIAVNIKLVAQSGGESTLLLASGTGVSAADNATLVAPMANTDNVAIYVQGTDKRYSIYATDGEFANLPVSFVTDRMDAAVQSYTLHFEDVLGGAGTGSLRLKDVVTGTEITIADGDSYGPFVVNTTNCPSYVAGENTVVNRFVINYVAPSYVIMNGDFANPGGAWDYSTGNFTDNGTTFTKELDLAANTWYHFQLEEGSSTNIAANGSAFDRTNTSHYVPAIGWGSQLTLHTDVAGIYTFTWEPLSDILTITFPAYVTSVTTNEYGWASFSYNQNLVPVNATAQTLYKGAINGDVLALDPVDYVKADEGVIVYGEANTTYYFGAGSGSSSFADNDLKPSSLWSYDPNDVIYCLKGDALYQYTGVDFPANKAYLKLNSSSGAPRRISLQVNAEQGVENVNASVKAEKFVENGQILIKRGENVFNLQGQIVK